jgi:hypothetical protein
MTATGRRSITNNHALASNGTRLSTSKSAKLNTKAALIVGTGKLRHFGSAYQISYELADTVPCPNPRLTPEDGVTSPSCSQHRGDVFPKKFNFKL